ncbi:MAG: arylsulfatase [Luteolibacter sp.]|uniref:arylsulfatase n=1 Tax=Luteolibacter sp. TaxID=1962973 RepID=UPI0032632FE7
MILFFRPLLLSAISLAAISTSQAKAPNVLLILADDLGFSDLGCYGGEIPTPNIDKLASQGLRYTTCYNSARCCPSRAALVTGLNPHQAGIGSFATAKPEAGKGPAYTGHLLPNAVTLAEVLKDNGYSTWMVGKWHMGYPGPIDRGFENFYGIKDMLSHSEGQWDPKVYARLPEGKKPEITAANGKFYVTDVFTDYALEFLKQAREQKDKPWFCYLSYTSPHFPLHAPKADIDKNMATYRKGWDVLRAERLERMKKLGMFPADMKLPPRSMVPVDGEEIANGFSGKQNPAWDSLPEDRREDLARRMATFSAMVEHVDDGVGKVLADLDKNGETENTLVFFLSDNGACYEWGPFGFDGESRKGTTILHTGDELEKIGQAGTHSSYGSGWANLGNTPLTLYKHFCHEGGISSPLIVRWPAGKTGKNQWVTDTTDIMDIMPTVLSAAEITPPKERGGQAVIPLEGIPLNPTFTGGHLPERVLGFEHQEARGLRKGDWKLTWGKRMPTPPTWELYDLKTDRAEQNNLAKEKPELVKELTDEWMKWAKHVGVDLKD